MGHFSFCFLRFIFKIFDLFRRKPEQNAVADQLDRLQSELDTAIKRIDELEQQHSALDGPSENGEET